MSKGKDALAEIDPDWYYRPNVGLLSGIAVYAWQ